MRIIVVKQPRFGTQMTDLHRFRVGDTFDVSPAVALLMTAAGWVRPEMRVSARRTGRRDIFDERRCRPDRRSRQTGTKNEERV